MKLIRVKYTPPLGPMIQDLQRIFPNLVVNATTLRDAGGMLSYPEKRRHVYVKEFYNGLGVRTHCIVYSLVRDRFNLPLWIQGQELKEIDLAANPIDHGFLGHEVPVPDDPNDTEEDIVE